MDPNTVLKWANRAVFLFACVWTVLAIYLLAWGHVWYFTVCSTFALVNWGVWWEDLMGLRRRFRPRKRTLA